MWNLEPFYTKTTYNVNVSAQYFALSIDYRGRLLILKVNKIILKNKICTYCS